MKSKPAIKDHLKVIFGMPLLILFICLTSLEVSAETFTVRITSNGLPVAGAAIYGNQGVKNLAGRTTNAAGEWVVDTADLYSPDFVLAFTHNARALRFQPSEIMPSVSSCPGRVCNIEAFADGNPTAVLQWSSLHSSGIANPDMPIVVAGSDFPCPKFTDKDGYVLFAVRKNLTTCNDNDTNLSNNFYKVVNLQPQAKSCTFSTALTGKFNACTNGAQTVGYTTASCSAIADKPIGSSVSYEIHINQDDGSAAPGVKFYGVKSLESAQTDNLGKLKFNTTQIGVAPGSQISLIPYGYDYQFQPARLDISPNSCANNICKITAFRNGIAQGIVRWKVAGESAPLAGVSIVAQDFHSCWKNAPAISDQEGYAYFPSIVRANCDVSDNNRTNDFMSFNAVLAGCSFTHSAQNAFQLCPSQLVTQAEMRAYCGIAPPSQYAVSGIVYDRDGFPLNGAQIKNAGIVVASSDISGRYSLVVDDQSSPSLEVAYQDFLFDPSKIAIDKVSRNFDAVNFYAVAPSDNNTDIHNPIVRCEAKPQYEISGFVYDEDGSPLANATILNNQVEVATSDQFGHYSFMSIPGEDLWVSVDYPDAFVAGGASFDPSARALLNNYCDKNAINFRRISVQSHVLYGKVTDSSGDFPIAGAEITISYQGISRVVQSASDGSYLHTVPDGVDYTLSAQIEGHDLTPHVYEYEADMSRFNLDFRSNISYAPTATPTATATITRTATNTATNTATYTASNTPTITATPTRTMTFTFSHTPTKTFTVTRTSVSTSTSTVTKTATFTSTASATNTFTQSATPSRTLTPTRTATATQSFTATNTPTVTRTFTASNTFTATSTATNSPTSTNTFTPTATSTFTATASATATIDLQPVLTSVCSTDPNTKLRWRVVNRKGISLTAHWDLYGSNQKGQIALEPYAEGYFETIRITNSSNTVRLFVGDRQVDVKASSYQQCATPTATATPTEDGSCDNQSGKVKICHVPPGNPGNAKTLCLPASAVEAHLNNHEEDYLGECRAEGLPTSVPTIYPTVVATVTYTPTPQPTNTPEAEEVFKLSGSLKDGSNGKNLSSANRRRLSALNLSISIRGLDGDRRSYSQSLQSPFNFEVLVPKGTYNISLESEGRLTVTSLPKKYKLVIKKNQAGINFGVRLKNQRFVD